MVANVDPIFSRTSDLQVAGAVIGPTANTATDGTGSAISVVHNADATEGSWVDFIRLKPVGSPATTVARLFYCSATGAFTAGTTNTNANTAPVADLGIAGWTISQTTASPNNDIPVGFYLPPGTKLLMSFGTSTGAAGTGFIPLSVGGKL
jgi:hypothetical protein